MSDEIPRTHEEMTAFAEEMRVAIESGQANCLRRVVMCPSCGAKMIPPLTRRTSDRAGGPNKYEKLYLCPNNHGYLRNGKLSKDPYGEDT